MGKGTARVALLAALAAGAMGVASCHRAAHQQHFVSHAFDRALWKAQPSRRGELVDDLLRRHLRRGLARSRVVYLLGRPSTSYAVAGGRDDVYDLGRYRRQAVDELVVQYRHGRVAKVVPPAGVPIGML
jgi:hypothetical protein